MQYSDGSFVLFVSFVVNRFTWRKCCPKLPKANSTAPSTANGRVLSERRQELLPGLTPREDRL